MPLGEGADCPYCLGRGMRPFSSVVSMGVFDEPLRTLIHELKYNGRWNIGEQIADGLLESEQIRDTLKTCDAISAVPLYRWRQIARGYNQSEIIAGRLAKRMKLKQVHPLIRLRNTPTQTNIQSRVLRIENMRNAFALVKPKAIAGRRVALVDDVMTTGATLRSAARAMIPGKPDALVAMVVALADPRRRGFQAI